MTHQPIERSPILGSRITRSLALAALAAVVAIGVSGCGSDDADASKEPPSSTSPSTTLGDTAAGTATIPVFEVPATAACAAGETSVTVKVQYQTAGAKRQRLLVDGADVPGLDEDQATLDVPVHCDTLPHTFVLVAYDANDQKTTQQKLLTTELAS
jgi:hypothetical protein